MRTAGGAKGKELKKEWDHPFANLPKIEHARDVFQKAKHDKTNTAEQSRVSMTSGTRHRGHVRSFFAHRPQK